MEKTIEIQGVRMRYDVEGSGPQHVVVLHGWGCRASTVKLLSDASLGTATTVYSLDLPGFGDSTEPPTPWNTNDYTNFLEKFIEAEGISNPVLIGHSNGGRISILYASRHPVRKLILVDSAGIKPRRSLKYYLKVYSFKAAKHILPAILGKKGRDIVDRMRGKGGSADYAAASPMMRAVMSRVVNEDFRSVMPSISAPTLLIWGEDDTATPLRDARIMEKLIPDAGLVSYPGCGHFSFLDRPAQTVAVIRSFLKINN